MTYPDRNNYLVYVENNKELEQTFKKKFTANLKHPNHEVIVDVKLEDILRYLEMYFLVHNEPHRIEEYDPEPWV